VPSASMSTTPPLAIRTAGLHQGHHSRLCLTTGPARSAAPAKTYSKKNERNRGGLSCPPQRYCMSYRFSASLITSILPSPTSIFTRQTSPHAPHSLNGDCSAEKPFECKSRSTSVRLPQLGHFMVLPPVSFSSDLLYQLWQNSCDRVKKLVQIRTGHVTHVGNTEGFALDLAVAVVKRKSGLTQPLFQISQINPATIAAAGQCL